MFSFSTENNYPSSVIEETIEIENSKESIFVEIAGAVANPGVYRLDEGSRVVDLLAQSDGIQSSASIAWVAKNLNLAKLLKDAEKVYIPFEWDLDNGLEEINVCNLGVSGGYESDSGAKNTSSNDNNIDSGNGSGSGTDNELININTADLETLDALPGIGPAYAQRIIDNRPYKDLQDMILRSTIPQQTADKIKDLISF